MRDHFKKYIAGAFLAGAVLVPGAAWAQDALGDPTESAGEAVEEDLEAGEEASKAWSASATVLSRAYQGMFADLENQDPDLSADQAVDPAYFSDRWLNLYVLAGNYKVDDFTLGASMVWSHWMTPGGGYVDQYEFRIEDPSLTASWSGYNIEPIDTRISASYSAALPASDVSRTANMVLGSSLSTTVSRTFFEKLSLSYTLGGGWTAHSREDATVGADTVQIYRDDEIVGNDLVQIGGLNTQFSLTNALGASFPIWDKLSGSVSYSITKYWTYNGDNNDEFTPEVEGIQTGRMTQDVTVASAQLSYPVGDYVSLAGGIRTSQLPKSADNRTFQFPWWNFSGAAGNGSALQLSVTGSY